MVGTATIHIGKQAIAKGKVCRFQCCCANLDCMLSLSTASHFKTSVCYFFALAADVLDGARTEPRSVFGVK